MTPLMPVENIARCCKASTDDVTAALAILGKINYGGRYLLEPREFRDVVLEVEAVQKLNQAQQARREALSPR